MRAFAPREPYWGDGVLSLTAFLGKGSSHRAGHDGARSGKRPLTRNTNTTAANNLWSLSERHSKAADVGHEAGPSPPTVLTEGDFMGRVVEMVDFEDAG